MRGQLFGVYIGHGVYPRINAIFQLTLKWTLTSTWVDGLSARGTRCVTVFPAIIRSTLNDLPKALEDTYCHTLLSINEKHEFAQRLF